MRDIKDELKAAIDVFNFQPGSMVYDAYTEIISLRHRLTQPASLSPATTSGSDEVIGALLAEKPFVFDPATNFAHADDGGAPEHGTLWAPVERAEQTSGSEVGGERLLRQLRALAVALHAKHYSDVTQWRPLDDAEGILSQIDNMTAGLSRATVALGGQHGQR